MVELTAEKINIFELETCQKAFFAESKISDQLEIDNQLRSFIGQSVVRREIQRDLLNSKEEELVGFRSLYQAIEFVKKGDKDIIEQSAVRMIKQNISAQLGEITRISGGHITAPIEAEILDNKISQHGHDYDDIYINTLAYTDKDSFSYLINQIEAKNHLIAKNLVFNRQLEDNYLVVFSGTPDDQPEEVLEANNYFVDKMPVSIQVTTVTDGKLLTQTAFVAGRVDSTTDRHDKSAIVEIARSFGVDYSSLSLKEILAKPILISKSALPDGVLGIVKKYDEVAGGTFFGNNKPVQDYTLFQERCRAFEDNLEPLVDVVYTNLMVDELINDEISAARALKEHSKHVLVDSSVSNRAIDINVFGSVAAAYLETARSAFDNNDQMGFKESLYLAQKTAKTFSCPSVLVNSDSLDNSLVETSDDLDNMPDIIRCPECGNSVSKKTAVHKGNLRCSSCRYEVEICSGKVVHASIKEKAA